MAGTGKNPEKVGDKMESMTSSAHKTASDLKGKAQDTASSLAQKGQDLAGEALRRTQDAASTAAQKAQDLASGATGKADDALSNVGSKISSLAGSLRETAPHEGALGTAASRVADRLEAGGQYLQEHGIEDMTQDLMSLVRRYPMQSILVGFGVGFLVGQTFSRR
ncbi:MAG: hypothetical protein JO112_07140 [Planctomycetes bacterium]|nr:hypothetical protein [Planctomycetota bacterium]